ncbi:MAG: thioredoxin family protein, partial [Prevotella sp.]|nr:thioredoxin family protein [Prevotella sp.]
MVKRLFLSCCIVLCGLSATAQTNFRAITYQQALEASKAEGKPVFIDFYTSWCGPCKMMARDVFPQQKVGDYFNANFVCIKLDAEKEGKEQAKKFKVSAYPTFKVISADEQEIFTFVGGNSDADAFVADIKAGVNPDLSPDRAAARYEQGDRSAELVSAYASQLMKEAQANRRQLDQSKVDKAQQVVSDYFKSLTDEQRLSEENNFVYGYSYCNDPKDEKARFLISQLPTITEARRTEAEQTLRTLFLYRTGTMLQGMTEFDQSDVNLLKQDITALGYNKGSEKAYDAAFRILSAQTQADRGKYIDQLEKDFRTLDVSQKASVVGNFAQSLRSSDPTIVKRADKWLRSQLADLDAASIYYAAGSLIQFEKQLGN